MNRQLTGAAEHAPLAATARGTVGPERVPATCRSSTPAMNQELNALSDPELIRRHAEVRHALAVADPSERGEIKREYDALAAEYRRRVEGWGLRP